MTDLLSLLQSICRPRLLIQAARIGLDDYNRTASLRRLLRVPPATASGAAIAQLINLESLLEEKRQKGDASYSIARHIETLTAIMGEARMIGSRRK